MKDTAEKTTVEHTPTPWIANIGQEDGVILIGQADSEDFLVAKEACRIIRRRGAMNSSADGNRARFIVKAANSFDELVAALAGMYDRFRAHKQYSDPDDEADLADIQVIDVARAALANAGAA